MDLAAQYITSTGGIRDMHSACKRSILRRSLGLYCRTSETYLYVARSGPHWVKPFKSSLAITAGMIVSTLGKYL